jgi:molybdopterin-biosynthesis enzyme MoeA-like protein
MAGIAYGFGVKVIRHHDLERRLRERHGKNINQARLRMAEVPEGAELIGEGSLYAPVVKFHNIYIFPGIPKILQERFRVIKERFRETPFFLKMIYVKEGEGVIASTLTDLLVDFPNLLLGSYPVLDDPDFKVKVTLESKDGSYLNRALERLLSTLPSGAIHRIDGN